MLILLIPHGQHTEGPLKIRVLMRGIWQMQWDTESSCSAFSFCELDGLCQCCKMIDSVPINTDLLLNTMVTKCCVSFRLSASAVKPSGNISRLKNFWCAYSSTKQQFRTERERTEISVTDISEYRWAACYYTAFNFSCYLQNLGIQNISLCCAPGIEQSWLCSCRSLDSPDSTDQELIFISCTSKRDKDKEIKEAHFFPHVPG